MVKVLNEDSITDHDFMALFHEGFIFKVIDSMELVNIQIRVSFAR